MDNGETKRRGKRLEVSYEIKVRSTGHTDYVTVVIKDISCSGVRAIISGRLIKAGELLEVKMCINNREIQCKGKVTWVLMLRPSLGNITVFDVGVEFYDMNVEDKEFLNKLVEK